jgi:hypothetical protein
VTVRELLGHAMTANRWESAGAVSSNAHSR